MSPSRARRYMRRHGPEQTVTVTYAREDGAMVVTRVGYGRTVKDALRDADEQLRPGRWTRLVVSTSGTILSDLQPVSARVTASMASQRGEGKTVTVPGPSEDRAR